MPRRCLKENEHDSFETCNQSFEVVPGRAGTTSLNILARQIPVALSNFRDLVHGHIDDRPHHTYQRSTVFPGPDMRMLESS